MINLSAKDTLNWLSHKVPDLYDINEPKQRKNIPNAEDGG